VERSDSQAATASSVQAKLRYLDLPGPKGLPFFGNAFKLDKIACTEVRRPGNRVWDVVTCRPTAVRRNDSTHMRADFPSAGLSELLTGVPNERIPHSVAGVVSKAFFRMEPVACAGFLRCGSKTACDLRALLCGLRFSTKWTPDSGKHSEGLQWL
jgi:hypothetical protein